MTWRILISAPYMRSVIDKYQLVMDQLAPHNANSSPLAHQWVHENSICNLPHYLQQKKGPGAS